MFVQTEKNLSSLIPQQLKILASVIPEKINVSFGEWISSTNQLYNITVSLLTPSLFIIRVDKWD